MSISSTRIDAAIRSIAGSLVVAPIRTEAIGLGSAVAGEALALLAADRFLDDDRVRSAASRRLSTIWARDRELRGAPVSLFDGRAGLGLLACHALDANPNDPEAQLALDRALRSVAQRLLEAPWMGHFDHVSGLAGISVFLCEPKSQTARLGGKTLCLRLAEELWRHSARTERGLAWTEPFSSPEDEAGSQKTTGYLVNMGLAHGSPGAVLALARLGRRHAFRPRHIEDLKDAVLFLLSHRGAFSDSGLSSCFPCMSALSHAWEVPSRFAWCYGDLGIIYTALAAAALVGMEDEIRDITSRVLTSCIARPLSETGINDGGLCHGDAGIVVMALAIRSLNPDADVDSLIEKHAERLLSLVERELSPDGLPAIGAGWKTFQSTDLLTGSSGVLLALLALRDAGYLGYLKFMGLDVEQNIHCPSRPEPRNSRPFLGIRVCLRSPQHDLGGVTKSTGKKDLEKRASELLHDQAFALSLFIARPDFFSMVMREFEKDERLSPAVLGTLFRFVYRMCFRPTPFGAFAAVGTAIPVAGKDIVTVADHHLDIDLDCGFLTHIAAGTAETQSTRVRCNPSAWWEQDVLHWITNGDLDGPWNHEQIIAAADSDLAEFIFDVGSVPVSDLETALKDRPFKSAVTISDLCRSEALIPQRDPILLGHDATARTLKRLERDMTAQQKRGLAELETALDAARENTSMIALKQLGRTAGSLAPGWTGDFLHVDAHCVGTLETPLRAVQALANAWNILEKIGFRVPKPNRFLEFERRFLDRHGDRAVLLGQAVDAESGLAYLGMPLRMDFVTGTGSSSDAPRHNHQDFPLETDWEARKWGLSAQDIEILHAHNTGQAPLAIQDGVLLGKVGRSSGHKPVWTAYPEGIFPGGPKAIFGRFSRRNQLIADALMQHSTTREKDSTIVEADILCATDPRSSNILRRASLSRYVIEILGDSGLPPERRIPLHDLWIRHDGSRFRLFWGSQSVEVSPQLHAAHQSPPGAPAVYLLLIDIAMHMRQPTVIWSWQSQSNRNRLPRVSAGNVILAPERWRLCVPTEVIRSGKEESWLETTRQKLELPRYVIPTDEASDMATPWDLDNPFSTANLIKTLKKGPLSICEYLPTPKDWWIDSPHGRLASELVFAPAKPVDTPYVEYDANPTAWQPLGHGAEEAGSWLYLRLFGDAMKLEQFLKLQSNRLALWQKRNLIENWFFVRYADPELELRLRLKLPSDHDRVLRNRVLVHLQKTAGGLVDRFLVDEYLPETARYGGELGLGACERIFGADSIAALHVLNDPEISRSRRWMASVASIDALFEDLELPTGVRLAISERCSENYGGGRASCRTARRATGKEWKSACVVLNELGVGKGIHSRPSRWNARAARLHPDLRCLQREEQDGRLGSSLADILGSLAHMSVNRILHWGTAAEEAVIHEALCRHYRTKLNHGWISS
ncbi:thiopeptide-type bacteriocin biosynthesis protein [uncultured Ruegeria sp.]|uniref:thiopeptide-type bacteriocin biosynthesis protein n=1 Tax=uncultured Ruegeria sp. TaxID=259304 RepID=UPI0026378BF8|nr:thiopeptide-type bacteriocin biosynthesis protein [uncultured Ruegeria sp.]